MKNSYKYIYTCRMQHNVKITHRYRIYAIVIYINMFNFKISYFFENAVKCAINVRFGHHINYPNNILPF